MALAVTLSAALAGDWSDAVASSPGTFFNDLASHLLLSEMNLNLSNLQVYPTNQYSPAVHRLLQLTANLYDATTNRADLSSYPYLPTVFRPLFRLDTNGDIAIVGYREVEDAGLASPLTAPLMVDPADATSRTNIAPLGTPLDPHDQNEPMVCGIPLVIGAKKGFPGFNQFAMENAVTVARTLTFHRQSGQPVSATNQSYFLSISNSCAIQAWNPYSGAYPRPLQMTVAGDVTLALTNGFGIILGPDGLPLERRISFGVTANMAGWPGFISPLALHNGSFIIPWATNCLFLNNAVFVHDQNQFVYPPAQDPTNYFPTPDWCLTVSERIRFILVDTSANRIVDYVNLSSSEKPLHIMDVVVDGAPCANGIAIGPDPDPGMLWCPDREGDAGTDDPQFPTYGILNQILVSSGLLPVSSAFWMNYGSGGSSGSIRAETVAFLERLYSLDFAPADPTCLDFMAPFTPRRTLYQHVSWQANDPLVHYTVPDLIDQFSATNIQMDFDFGNPVARIGSASPIAPHYRPWGGNPLVGTDTSPPTGKNVAIKDPLMMGADDWDFPGGEPLSLSNVGRIHRGTPWQTVYLKSTPVDAMLWMKWTGNADVSSAQITMPTNDWRLAGLLGLMSDTAPRQRLSINSSDTNAWLSMLDGLLVWTNSSPPAEMLMSSNSPQALSIAAAILRTRSTQPNGYFRHLGDVLATPELSLASPWLNTNNMNGAGDEALEIVPSQLLPRLREDSFGSVTADGERLHLQFSGYDHCFYSLEASPNLIDWMSIRIMNPRYGALDMSMPLPSCPGRLFFRTVLFPWFGECLPAKKFLFYPTGPVFIGGDESRHFSRGQRHPHEGADERAPQADAQSPGQADPRAHR